jgi:glycosyltransferase involved in cell wall biosynthesis
MAEPKRDIFICHASEDKPRIVEPLVAALLKKKVTLWYDKAEIIPGDNVPEKINEGMRSSRYVAVVLGPTFAEKPYAKFEMFGALHADASEEGVRLIPILAGTEEEKRATLEKFPLIGAISHIPWEGDPAPVVAAILRRLGREARSVSRVCFISSEYPPKLVGGLGVHVNELTRSLAARIHVDVVLPSPGGGRYRPPPAQVELHALAKAEPRYEDPVSWLYFANHAANRILGLAETARPDVIHCHDWVTVLAGIKCRERLKVPLIFHLHLPNRSKLCASIENLGLVCADLVTVNSQAMAESLGDRQLPIRSSKVVKNGVDADLFRPCEDWPADDGYVLFVGRLVKQKGVEYLLRAVYYAQQRLPDIRLKVVGDGELRPMLERLCKNFLISDKVEFLGWKEGAELVRLYQKARVVVVPSIYEPFGMTAIEALACQRPVVASKVDGLGDLIEDGVTGYRVAPGKPLDLAQWIMTLLSDPGLRERMGEAGRRFVVDNGYNWTTIGGQFINFYEDLAAKPLRRPPSEAVAEFKGQIEELAVEMSPSLRGTAVLKELFAWGGRK